MCQITSRIHLVGSGAGDSLQLLHSLLTFNDLRHKSSVVQRSNQENGQFHLHNVQHIIINLYKQIRALFYPFFDQGVSVGRPNFGVD